MRLSLSLSTPHSSFLRLSTLSPTPPMASGSNSLVWFRKGIRIHDNPALEYAAKGSSYLYPVFVIDPRYMEPDPTAFSPGSARAGVNRIRFLLESLADLDSSLRKLGSRLLVLKGEPGEVLFRCLKESITINRCGATTRPNSTHPFASGVAHAAKHPAAFMPFGLGGRRCVGQNLAILQAKLAIAMILQRFSFDLAPSYQHAPTVVMLLNPQHGAPIMFRKL
ncbi:hypothetical protein RHSIM_Rhsim12G0194000 [Rhododendron simsii]|uniref:Photolyase/cryptochrome alpha/beta domain-containing protein n=1 Tax=Rhododendron simsii TaxID=118357 RepID=A0A834LA58_RHOSS|nr:hypothetical protein RHSIM_Rhsim12G0194000 [Rhododendron simsii]